MHFHNSLALGLTHLPLQITGWWLRFFSLYFKWIHVITTGTVNDNVALVPCDSQSTCMHGAQE